MTRVLSPAEDVPCHFHVDNLSELLGKEVLEIILTGLSQYTGRPLGVVELMPDARRRTDLPLEERYWHITPRPDPLMYFCRYCRALRDVERTKAKCQREEYEITHDAQTREHRVYWRVCQFGFVDLIIPLVVNKRVLGVFFAGQFRLDLKNSTGLSRERFASLRKKISEGRKLAARLYGKRGALDRLYTASDAVRKTVGEIASLRQDWVKLAEVVRELAEEKYGMQREVHDRRQLQKFLLEPLVQAQTGEPHDLWGLVATALEAIRAIVSTEAIAVLAPDEAAGARSSFRCVARVGKVCDLSLDERFVREAVDAPVQLSEDGNRCGEERDGEKAPSLPAQRALWRAIASQFRGVKIKCLLATRSGVSGLGDLLVLCFNRSPLPGRVSETEFSRYAVRCVSEAAAILGAYVGSRRAAIQELRHSSELRRTLAAQSHKVNAALQAIFGKVSTLTRLSRKTDGGEEVKKEISREVAKIRTILERLKAMARVVGYAAARADGKAPLSLGGLRPVNLHNLVQDCVNDFRELAASEGVRVQYRGENALVMGSKTHLYIIVNNILDNAIKYSFGRYEVSVQLGVVEREVRLVVGNYGIGVPEAEQARVFELYWRANVPYGRKAIVGSGIGLTVAQIVAQAHGGTITFNSCPPPRSDRYKGSYSESDIARGLCHTVVVTLVLPLAAESEKGSEND